MSNLKARLRSFSINVGEEAINMSEFTLGLIEALKDKTVSDMLCKSLALQIKPLCDRVDDLKGTVVNVQKQIKERDAKIVDPQTQVDTLITTVDNLEQYSKRVNIRVDGIEEPAGEKPMEAVSHLVNHILKLSPPLQSCEVDRCHRIGPAKDRQGNPRKRPLLVKFTSYGSRARVLGLRGRLRALARGDPLENPSWPAPLLPPEDSTTESPEGTVADDDPRENATPQINYEDYANKPIYFNEDLTKSRSLLAK